MKECPNPCDGCALTAGAEANLEPHNQIKARLCVLGGTPFFCHENIDWRDSALDRLTREQFRALGVRICQGWAREIRKLAEAGYFQHQREWKRVWAEIAEEALSQINLEDDPEEKEYLLRSFKSYWLKLHEIAAQFGYQYEVSDAIREGYTDEAGLLLAPKLQTPAI